MKLRVAMLAVAASLAGATTASADTFTVTGFGDALSPPPCTPAGASGTFQCTTLRAAVEQANAITGEDTISLGTGTYLLNAGDLVLSDDVTVAGLGARQTIVTAVDTGEPVFTVGGTADVGLGLMTIRGGTSNLSILPGSTAAVTFARLTGATSNAGVLNEGDLGLGWTLVDGNNGGGIRSVGGSQPTILTVRDSTVAANSGAGISSTGNAQNLVDLEGSTIARNSGAGLSFDGQQIATADNSIIAANGGGANCDGGTLTGATNVEDATTCALPAGANRVASDPQLSPVLTNAGGYTDVLTIPAGSPAADYVASCPFGVDQRGFQRSANQPCDAGAYDRDAVDPGFPQDPVPTPTPVVPTPQTPQPTPEPVVNRTAVARETRGTVKVQLPGSKTFVDLDATQGIPMGSTIDTRKGAVEITTVPKAGAPPEKAVFSEGLFKLTQSKGITNLTLVEPLDCAKQRGRASAAQKARKPKKRRLWGDGKGSFRTTGRYSAATVRGTRWLVEDTCTTTTTTVRVGA